MITDLKKLWKQAFGDSDAFLDSFFRVAYAPDRCRYLLEGSRLAAALYWFDCALDGRKLAYIYAVATDEAFQNRGLCRRLMTETHDHLRAQGYAGAILVPGSRELFALYEKLGYRTCSHVDQITCAAGTPVPLRPIGTEEYAAARRALLPDGGVVQEGTTLDFLACFAHFYAGDGFVLAATAEAGKAHIHELLGKVDAAGVVAALSAREGCVRTPGTTVPFAMYHSLDGGPAPSYFGLALD